MIFTNDNVKIINDIFLRLKIYNSLKRFNNKKFEYYINGKYTVNLEIYKENYIELCVTEDGKMRNKHYFYIILRFNESRSDTSYIANEMNLSQIHHFKNNSIVWYNNKQYPDNISEEKYFQYSTLDGIFCELHKAWKAFKQNKTKFNIVVNDTIDIPVYYENILIALKLALKESS